VFQTAGAPPNRGKTILANIGWIKKSKKALRNKAIEKIISNFLFLGYATRPQRDFILACADRMVQDLSLRT
jgi:hypothetical protein